MERVFWLLAGRDGALVKGIMEDFQSSHRHTLPEQLHKEVQWSLLSVLYEFSLKAAVGQIKSCEERESKQRTADKRTILRINNPPKNANSLSAPSLPHVFL